MDHLDVGHHCGRVSRHTCGLTHSKAFLSQSSRWTCNPRLLYTFSLSYFSHIIKLLTISLFNFEIQVEDCDMIEGPQNQLTYRSWEFGTHHRPARFSSRFSLSSWRIALWFWFYFRFLSIFGTVLQDLRSWHISHPTASQHPTQWTDRVDGRAAHLLLGVLRTCCGSESRYTECKKKYHSKKYLENILKIIFFQYVYLIIKYGKNYFDFFHYIECLNMV